jgi:UPF0716 family protein affecting phage T7 exclusion
LLAHLKKAWRELKRGKPGRRFSERYERGRRRGTARKWLLIAGGALLALAGIVLLPLPGPGMLVIAVGLLLIAEESRATARALDWLERKARSLRR